MSSHDVFVCPMCALRIQVKTQTEFEAHVNVCLDSFAPGSAPNAPNNTNHDMVIDGHDEVRKMYLSKFSGQDLPFPTQRT